MIEIATSFIKEKSPAFFAVVLIFSGSLLFLPDAAVSLLGLQAFIDEYRIYFGAALLFSVAYLFVHLLVIVWFSFRRFLRKKNRQERRRKERKEYMENLTYEEVLYILPFVVGINTLNFLSEDGTRGSLEAKGIIYRSSSIGSMLNGFSYNIQPWALQFMRENSSVYEKHVGAISSEEDFERIYKDGKPWERKFW